jgi:hypothetical protein
LRSTFLNSIWLKLCHIVGDDGAQDLLDGNFEIMVQFSSTSGFMKNFEALWRSHFSSDRFEIGAQRRGPESLWKLLYAGKNIGK